MPALFLRPGPWSLWAVGGAAVALGLLVFLLTSSWQARARYRPFTWAASLLLAGGVALVAGLSDVLWRPALVLAGVWGLFGLARSPLLRALGQGVANLTSHPRAQGGLLFAGGISLLVWQAFALERGLAPLPVPPSEQHALPPGQKLPKVIAAQTDAGFALVLYPPSTKGQGPVIEISAASLREQGLEHRVIQVGPARNDHNCHGWVFTGGRFSVPGTYIERILEDNDYQEVSAPAAGDVGIFRDTTGQVTHSALVQTVASDGLILLESKWGLAGRYIHSPEDHIYRKDTLTYYRTGRGTHLLRGLDRPAGEKSPGSPQGEKQGRPWG